MKNYYIKLQKMVFVAFLVAAGLLLIFSFIFTQADWFQLKQENLINFYTNQLEYHSEIFTKSQEAIDFYNSFWPSIQAANNQVFYTAIVAFVALALCAIFGNFSRRRFYVSNLVIASCTSLITIIFAILSIVKVAMLKSKFDFARPDFIYYHGLDNGYGVKNPLISGDSLILQYIMPIVIIIIAGLFLAFTIFKYNKTNPRVIARKERQNLKPMEVSENE